MSRLSSFCTACGVESTASGVGIGEDAPECLVAFQYLDVPEQRSGERAEAVRSKQGVRWVSYWLGSRRADEDQAVGVDVVAHGDLREVGVVGCGQAHRRLGLAQGDPDGLGAGDGGVEPSGEDDGGGVVDGVGHGDKDGDGR
jgi:hypothetical protein